MTELPTPHAPDLLTPAMLDALAKTRPWVRFLAIVGFVTVSLMGLLAIGGLVMGLFGTFAGGDRIAIGMAFMYLLFAMIYLIPARFLWRYASSIGEALEATSKVQAVEAALQQQKSFWKFAGIVTLIGLLLYIPMIVLVIALPSITSAFHR